MKKTLLVNYVYWQPVGHAIEALRYSLGYHLANPDAEVSVVLNKHTAVALASLCSWIKNTYTVDIPDEEIKVTSELYSQIPRVWDYVVSDHRSHSTEYCPGAFYEYYQHANKYFDVRIARGYCGDDNVPYSPASHLKLNLPTENLAYAEQQVIDTPIKIALMLAGNKDPEFFPSLESWQKIIDALYEKYSDRLSIYLVGKLSREHKETLSGVERSTVDELLKRSPRSVDCFDIGLLNQLAVISKCNLFISPHTGFAFAVESIGIPWLTISGGTWAEYYFNYTPFYSVLPDPSKYPCYNEKEDYIIKDTDGENRAKSMSNPRIEDDLDKIVRGAEILINKEWNFDQCIRDHLKRMKKHYPDKVWSFDNLHEKYLS